MTSTTQPTNDTGPSGARKRKQPDTTNGTILVVDDEPGVLLTIQAILAQEGYAVDSAPNGKIALEKLRRKTYDLVLTDLRLGDIDGLDVLAELRKLNTRTVAIVLTGYASLESAIQAMREGAYDYLVKPTDVDELKLRVARVFERHHLTDELARRVYELEQANATIDRMNDNLRHDIDEATAQLRTHVASLNATKNALEAAREQRDRFIAMVAHDLRTPLTRIQMAAQFIARYTNPSDSALNNTGMIEENVKLMERLITDLFDVTRIDTGTFKIEPAPCDLTELAGQMVEEYRLTREDREFVFEAPEAPITGTYDRARIAQALGNLLGNAVKYSDANTTITVRLDITPDSWARLSVADQGAGIPPDKIDQLFQPFRRLEGTEHIEGYGLGLYITKGIAEAHGGALTVESGTHRAQGATITLSLPGATAKPAGG
jgi:signal transduction histidine kinase